MASKQSEPEVSAAQHENALARIRKLEKQYEMIVHTLAVSVGVTVPKEPDE